MQSASPEVKSSEPEDSYQRSLRMSCLNMKLVSAAQDGDYRLTQELLDQGADANFIIPTGENENQGVIHVAAQNGNVELISLLAKYGCNLNLMNDRHQSALHLVVTARDVAATRILLELGCDVNVLDDMGRTPLILSCSSIKITRLLVNAGCDLNIQDMFGCTALRASVMANNIESASVLIKAGAKVNYTVKTGRSYKPLMVAAMLGHEEMVDLLLENGADPLAKGYNQITALHEAAVRANTEYIVQKLLLAGSDPEVRNNQGETPLVNAIKMCRAENVMVLVKGNCCVNYIFPTHNETFTPLHLSLMKCHELVPPHRTGNSYPMMISRRILGLYFKISKYLLTAGAQMFTFSKSMFKLAHFRELVQICHTFRDNGVVLDHWDVLQVLEYSLKEPTSLGLLCKVTIRRTLGRHLHQKVPHLTIPVCLHNELLFSNISDI